MGKHWTWESLGLGVDEEDPALVKERLDRLHNELLEARGLSTKPEKNSPGFKPTAAQAREVAVMTCLGLDPKDIANVLNVEVKLLNIYYAKELNTTLNIANAMVARQALQMALSGRNPDMTKFWLKAKAGWRETTGVDVTTKGESINGTTAKDKLRDTLAAAGVIKKKDAQEG